MLAAGAGVIVVTVLALAFVLAHSVAGRTTIRGDRMIRSNRSGASFSERFTGRLPVRVLEAVG